MRSSAIGNNGTTYLMASVKKAGTVLFWWKAQEYVTVRGTTLEQLFLDYLKTELKRRHEVDAVMSKLDALAKKTSARLTGIDLPRECMVYSC